MKKMVLKNYPALRRYAAFLLLVLLACEKDDICIDDDTPHLIIRFYDKDNPETVKAVEELRVIGDGLADPLSTVNQITTDSIAIPLRSLETMSMFSFISNSDDSGGAETGNIDMISFDYETREVFVSRACGYVTNYENLNTTVTGDADNWITNTTIINATVDNEATAHINIFH